MIGPNGRANGGDARSSNGAESHPTIGGRRASKQSEEVTPEQINKYIAELETPFHPSVIEWRVTNTNHDKSRGQVTPYADQRAYTDRLNALFTPAGWTRRYAIHTSANFQRGKDQKIVAKVLVTCELTVFGFGSHSATGEEWADDDNAGTSAEAQAFKRACSCFGLGRYLYYFDGVWVDLDARRRPTSVPSLPRWATAAGWVEGFRPNSGSNGNANPTDTHTERAAAISEIEAMSEPLGRGLYRGLLRDLAKVWSPREIHDVSIQEKVLQHMRAAERGLRRLEAALDKVGHEALVPVLKSLRIASVERVDSLETLKRIVLELERIAKSRS